jgi:RNA polymerase sigma factor (sigma-70 family)
MKSNEEIYKMIEKIRVLQSGDNGTVEIEELQQAIVQNYHRLLWKVVRGFNPSASIKDDLFQEGTLGILHAIQKFDPNRGASFLTCAYLWSKSYILNFMKSRQNRSRMRDVDLCEIENTISDPEIDLVEDCYRSELRRAIRKVASSKLTDRERFILSRRFESEETLEETSREIGLTRERVRQIEGEALEKLKRSKDLREFCD